MKLSSGSSPERDLETAIACAEAYLRLAEPAVLRIRDVAESTQPHPFSSNLGDVVAAATNLAFAIELYIKTILLVSKVDVPLGREGHNLGKLHAAMPQHFKGVIGRSYEETRKKDWHGKYPSVTLSIRQISAGLPKWDDNGSDSLDLQALLDRSSDIFTRWRYIYEFKKPDDGGFQFHPLEYGLLLSACRAMRGTIRWLQKPTAE
jgi:hypothetical protein